jgi:hypothetical protein
MRHRVLFQGVKQLGRGVYHPPPSAAEVKVKVELYLYSPSRLSCSPLGRNLFLGTIGGYVNKCQIVNIIIKLFKT